MATTVSTWPSPKGTVMTVAVRSTTASSASARVAVVGACAGAEQALHQLDAGRPDPLRVLGEDRTKVEALAVSVGRPRRRHGLQHLDGALSGEHRATPVRLEPAAPERLGEPGDAEGAVREEDGIAAVAHQVAGEVHPVAPAQDVVSDDLGHQRDDLVGGARAAPASAHAVVHAHRSVALVRPHDEGLHRTAVVADGRRGTRAAR